MSGPVSTPVPDAPGKRLELSALQHAWMAEIGLERRLLGHYRPAPTAAVKAISPPPSTPERDNVPAAVSGHAAASGPGLAMAALKQAGGQRRPSLSASTTADGLQHVSGHVARGHAVRHQDLPGDWVALQEHAEACQACGLHAQRDRLVFGAGETQQPDWLIVGEAPGKADDRSALPFQGKAGQLLHAMLVAVGVHPASVVLAGRPQPVPAWSEPASMYFSNLIKCRPLGNRSPDAIEAAACAPYLLQQIELLQPRRILALGRLAAQALLSVDGDVEDLRGRVHHVSTRSGVKIPVIVTWHPAALLMHPQNKVQAWADLNRVKRI